MKAPGGAPKVLSEEDKRRLIEDAKTIDELCDAIRKIGPIGKGFLWGKTDVAEMVKGLNKAYKMQDSDLLHPDTSYYSIYANLGDKINQLIVKEYERVRLDEEGQRRLEEESVRIMSEQEKTDYIQSAPNPGELYKRVRQIGNFELKLGLDDSEAIIGQIKYAIRFLSEILFEKGGKRHNNFKNLEIIPERYGLRERVRDLFTQEVNTFFKSNLLSGNFLRTEQSDNSGFESTKLTYDIQLFRIANPIIDSFQVPPSGSNEKFGPDYFYFASTNFQGIQITTFCCDVLDFEGIKTAKNVLDIKLRQSILKGETYLSYFRNVLYHDGNLKPGELENLFEEDQYLKFQAMCDNLTLVSPSTDPSRPFIDRYIDQTNNKESEYDKHLRRLRDKESAKDEPKLKSIEKTRLVARVVANLKQSKFGSYQDYMHAALFLINKHWPAGKSKTNDEVQEIFEMVEAEMKSATSIKQEKVILSEEKKKEIVKDIVSQIKVKYSYGEYSKKDIREYLEDVTKTLIEKLDKESVAYNGKDVVELMLKIIEEWAVSAPLVPAKDLQVSAQVEQLKQEVKKLHETVKLQQQKGTEVVNVNTTKYVLVEKFNVNFKLFGIEIDNYFDISSIVEAVWKILTGK